MLLLLACTQKSADDTATPQDDGPSPDIDMAPSIDFGDTILDGTGTRTLTVSNVGQGTLNLGPPSWLGVGGAFSFGEFGADVLEPGASTELTLTFSPTSVGAASAVLMLRSDDPDEAAATVNLSGEGVEPTLAFEPSAIVLDSQTAECPVSESFLLVNVGEDSVQVTGLAFSEKGAFTVDLMTEVNGPLPWTLASGESASLGVSLAASTPGVVSADLTAEIAEADGVAATAVVSGELLATPVVTDTFEADGGMIDIVIPLQVSGTGSGYYTDPQPLIDAFPDTLDALDDAGVNYHVMVVTQSDGCATSESPWFDETWDRDDQMDLFEEQALVYGNAHGLVTSAEATLAENSLEGGCNEGLMREKAPLAVISYTYVGYNHPDMGWSVVAAALQTRADEVKIHGIVEDLYNGCGMGSHSYWSDAIELTEGVWNSICDPTDVGMENILPALIIPERIYTLSETPEEDSLNVTVNGNGVSFEYDDSDNTVQLDASPELGDEVVVTYTPVQTCE